MDLIKVIDKAKSLNMNSSETICLQVLASCFIRLLEIAQKESVLIEDITEDMLIDSIKK
jgi:hypothetical protein